MYWDRTILLDFFLAAGIGVAVFLVESPSLAQFEARALWLALGTGAAVFLGVRFFFRRFFFVRQPRQVLERRLAQLSTRLQGAALPLQEELYLLEEAAALSLALERWEESLNYHDLLLDRLRAMEEAGELVEEREDESWALRRLHVRLARSFVLLQEERHQEALECLEVLQDEVLSFDEPRLRLLIDLFRARIIASDDREEGDRLFDRALEQFRLSGNEEDGLRFVASELMSLGDAGRSVELLERALVLAEERHDREAVVQTIRFLGHAHVAAGHLPQAAEALVRLTRSYLQSSIPSAEEVDELRLELRQRFGAREARAALLEDQRDLT